MSEVEWHAGALSDLERLHGFLRGKDVDAARAAAAAVLRATDGLGEFPYVGRPTNDRTDRRELVVPFGSAGYVVCYRVSPEGVVVILSVWHTREGVH